MSRRSKIIATVGPASASSTMLKQLIDAGMDVARLNFSHGDHDTQLKTIESLRKLSRERNQPLAILQDLQGPKLRTGILPSAKRAVKDGERVTLTTDLDATDSEYIPVNYAPLAKEVAPGDRILIDDGNIELQVIESDGIHVETEVLDGGQIGSRKGINVPGVSLSADSITLKDREDLAFGLSQGVNAIALSFVRRREDIQKLRQLIEELRPGERVPLLIAKLERPEAIDNLEGILEVSDGVMVARGDLGVEVSPEKVPSLQKQIIREALSRQRFVITATQMLESMISNPRPTRAEASDVANAVFDGSDALMLSGETAVGKYPKQSLATMHRIIIDAEQHAVEWGQQIEIRSSTDDDAVATTHAARALAHDRQVAALAVFTRSGHSARLLSSVRPEVPILAFTPEAGTYHQLAIAWGVIPYLIDMAHSVEEMIEHVRKACLQSGIVSSGQQVVMVASLPVGAMGPPNFTLLHTIS
jgi:pyruvate kinase